MIYILTKRVSHYQKMDDYKYEVLSHHVTITQEIIRSVGIIDQMLTPDYMDGVRWIECYVDENIEEKEKLVSIFNDVMPINRHDNVDDEIISAVNKYKVVIREEKLNDILNGK